MVFCLIKIRANKPPSIKFGEAYNAKSREWVLAIGSPFGFDYSVTAGIISAIGRSLPNENYVPFIQTDVAINPGNSGGPLFNLDGEVIGVNSQIYSRTGGFMGLSFAVPIDVVKSVYTQLKENGHVARGWLGVLIQDVTRELAESFGMDHPHGALIAKVLSDGPAEKAKFEVGDIVVKFNGKKVSFSSDLPPLVGSTPVDTRVPVEIIRRSKHQIIQVKISELPTDDTIVTKKGNKGTDADANSLNVIAKDLTKEERKERGIDDHGVLVVKISVGPAQKAGVRQEDILLLINNIKIEDVAHFNKIIKDLPKGRSIPLLIQRQGSPIFLALKIDE
jgi:serine protease Do